KLVEVASPTVILPAPVLRPVTNVAAALVPARDPIVSVPPLRSSVPLSVIAAVSLITLGKLARRVSTSAPLAMETAGTPPKALLTFKTVVPALAVNVPEKVFAAPRVKALAPALVRLKL